jgi:hypothetical protein
MGWYSCKGQSIQCSDPGSRLGNSTLLITKLNLIKFVGQNGTLLVNSTSGRTWFGSAEKPVCPPSVFCRDTGQGKENNKKKLIAAGDKSRKLRICLLGPGVDSTGPTQQGTLQAEHFLHSFTPHSLRRIGSHCPPLKYHLTMCEEEKC